MTSTELSVGAVRRRRIRRSRLFGWLDDRVDVVTTWGLPALVVGSVLAVGTVHVPVLLVVAACALPLGALALWSETRHGHRPPLAVVVLMGLGAFSLLQAVRLPFVCLERVAPSSASVWLGARELLGDPPRSWASVSLDPGASVVEALKWLTYAAVTATAVRFGRRLGTASGPLVVFVAAGIAAITTLVHGAVGAQRLYGVYQPSFTPARWAMSPLLNSNNYAGYLNLAIFCGMGLLVAPPRRLPRPAIGIALAALVAVSTISASRGALGALALGVLVLIPLLAWLNRRSARTYEPWFWAGPLPVAIVAFAGLILAVLGGGRDKWQSLVDESLVKFSVIERTFPMIRRHWLLGSGRGSFETVFPAYAVGPGNTIYQHAENFVAEWLAEWGVPVAAAGLLLLCYAFRPGRLRAARSKVAACALVGVGALLFQNLFDLALEVPAVCIALGALLGALLGAASDHTKTLSTRAKIPVWRTVAALAPAAGLALLPLAGMAHRTLALRERATVHSLLVEEELSKRPARAAFWEALGASVRRHPADPYLALLGATAARYDARHRPLAWVGWTIERSPTRGAPYLLLARILLGYGAKDQALHVLSLAAATGEGLDSVTSLAVRTTRDLGELERAVPPGRAGAIAWLAMARQLDEREDSTLRLDLLRRAVAWDPGYTSGRVALVSALLKAVEHHAPPCEDPQRERCLAETDTLLSTLARAPPPDQGVILLRGGYLAALGKTGEAHQWLTHRCADASDRLACERERVILAYKLHDDSASKSSVDDFLQVACSSSGSCASAARWAGDLAASEDQWSRAVDYYERAAQSSSSAGAWLKVADAANRAGLISRAIHAARRADDERRRAPGPRSAP
ncbi:MAG: O-antigen ligase family protein [Polyangiaceae bacterium]|nr:O-antigen ligase family protein [Polyangiaceae bacterium]